jgi:TolB-like protein
MMSYSLIPRLFMADVFVSYASEDRKRIEPFVDLLKQQGWSVWWDRDLIVGPTFDQEIEQELLQASCVVVLWSRYSIESTWCRAEATEALERKILVPVLIDDVRPPLAFRAAQTASLVGWPRSPDNVGEVLKGISVCLGMPRHTPVYTVGGQKKPRRLAAIIAGAIVSVTISLWVVIDSHSPNVDSLATDHDIVRIAVLPFEDFSTSSGTAHIAAGFQEDIISRLAELDELEVTSRSSTKRFTQPGERSMLEIARDLSVSHVIEGSIRKSGDQLRVSVQLIDANTDSQLWAESYDRRLANIFAVQTDIARDVALQLEKNFSNQTPSRFVHSPTDDLQAYELVLKGRELLAVGTAKSLAQAEEVMAEAAARDPGLAEAHAGIARALFLQTFLNTTWSEVRAKALQASETALELDPESASIHTNHAHILGVWEGDKTTARQHYQKAIELEPNNSFSLLHYGAHLAALGEVEQGLTNLQRAKTLDPLSGEISFYLASALQQLGRLDEAAQAIEHGLKFNPNDLNLLALDLFGLTNNGELFAAFDSLHKMALVDPHHFQTHATFVHYLSRIGELDAAQLWVDRMHTMSQAHEDIFEAQRLVYNTLGDTEGLTRLAGQWQTLNTIDRATRQISNTISFATRCQLQVLALRADDARSKNDRETERILRRGAMEIAQEILTDEKGNLVIDGRNQEIALNHALHQRLLGLDQEASAVLNAIVQSGDEYDLSQIPRIFNAYALLGDNPGSLDFFRTRPNQFNDQTDLKMIRDNRFGLYDSLLANEEFAEFIESAIASNEALQIYLRQELPSMLTATTGL